MDSLRQIQTRAPLAYPLIALIAGLLASKACAVEPIPVVAAGFVASITLLVLCGKRIWYLAFLCTGALLFYVYGEIRLPNQPDAAQLAMPPREVTVTLEIERVLQERTRYNSASAIARVLDANWQSRLANNSSVYCRIDLPDNPERSILRGQQLRLTGVLTPLPAPESEERNFESYLRAIGVHHQLDRTSQLEWLQAPNTFEQFCHRMNRQFQQWLQLGAPEGRELSNVYLAMLLGRKAELSGEQSERYRMTGTMHFFAISGLHIGVIATVIAQTLRLLRVPNGLSPWIGLPLVYCYVEITGASPSAVRAFLMAAFFWASYAFQRQRSPFAALIGSAFFVLMIVPQQLWSVGFQLSYAVVLSILLFGLPLNAYLQERLQPFRWLPPDSRTRTHRLIEQAIKGVSLLFAISCSAWLASAPLSATYFGFIAPGAILLNMLLVHLASLVICGGIIAIGCGFIQLSVITLFLNHSAWVSISLMDTLVVLFTQIPGAIIHCSNFPSIAAYSLLIIYFSAITGYHFYLRQFSHHWLWAAPAILLALLALCTLGG